MPGNPTTRNCIFVLDTTRAPAQNAGNFFRWVAGQFRVEGTGSEKICASFHERGQACSICQVGPFNASIRNVRHAATGCVPSTPEGNTAATVARRFAMCRLRSARACGCVPVHWAATVRWAVRPGVRASCQNEVPGPARLDLIGASRPRNIFLAG